VRFKLYWVYVDLNLPVLAAKRLGYRRSRHAGNLVAHVELPLIVQLGLVQPFALERDQADWQAGGIELEDNRRQCARW
jgi:hypothetical protein